MKKFITVLLLFILVLCISACGKQEKESFAANTENLKHNEIVTDATEQLKNRWRQEYQKAEMDNTDGYFEVKNVRVITVKDNDIALFQDVAYIIEYDLYTDYMGAAPYYEDCGMLNNVVIYKDGTMNVSSNLVRSYRNQTYQTDYSGFIQAIDDYQGQYNCIEKMK